MTLDELEALNQRERDAVATRLELEMLRPIPPRPMGGELAATLALRELLATLADVSDGFGMEDDHHPSLRLLSSEDRARARAAEAI